MDKLSVNFVSQGSAYLASHRMRVTKPAELLNVGVENIEATTERSAVTNAHVNIFAKHFDQQGSIQSLVAGKDLGYYTVFDVCDDHFDRKHGSYYERMCEEADVLTCNSKNMQERIYEVTGELARIIPDPITFPEGAPGVSNTAPKFIWYGHGSNARSLHEWLPHVCGRVTAVCDATLNHPNIDHIPWRPLMAEKHIVSADIVLIPTEKNPWTKCKSPNRAVDAIQAGKFVITDNEDIYGDLKDFIYIVEDAKGVEDAIEWYKNHPEDVKQRIENGQKFIEDTYGDDAVLDGWLSVFKDLGLIKNFEEIKNEA